MLRNIISFILSAIKYLLFAGSFGGLLYIPAWPTMGILIIITGLSGFGYIHLLQVDKGFIYDPEVKKWL